MDAEHRMCPDGSMSRTGGLAGQLACLPQSLALHNSLCLLDGRVTHDIRLWVAWVNRGPVAVMLQIRVFCATLEYGSQRG
jgi:hypothetical protein